MKTNLVVLLSLLYYFFVALDSMAQNQNLQFQHFGVGDGLSQSKVNAIFQDSRGYIWIGTAKGLNKFNGHRFDVFLPSLDSTKTSLSHQTVYAITEDENGNIWAGTRNGVSKYNPQIGEFTNFTKVGDCKGCLSGTISKVLIEDSPYIYIGSNAGLSRIHTTTGKVKGWWHTEETKNIPHIYSIRDIEKLNEGELLLATDEGLVFFHIEKEQFILVGKNEGLPDNGNGIECIFKDSQGTYWLAMARSGVVKIIGNPSDSNFQQLPIKEPEGIPSVTVYDIIEYPVGTLWFATQEGIAKYNLNTKKYSYIKREVAKEHSISTNSLTNMLVDTENRIWLGSNYGLDVYDPYLNQFELLTASENKQKSLASNNTSVIFQDSKETLWFGSMDNGITVLQQENGNDLFYHINAGEEKNQLPHPTIYGIGEDHLGKIYIATGAGPVILDWPDRNTFNYSLTSLPTGDIEKNQISTPYIYSFKKDKKGNLWLPTYGKGVFKIDKNGKIRQYLNENQDPTLQSSDFVTNIEIDDDGIIWTTNSGTGIGFINTVLNDSVIRKFKAKTPFTRTENNNLLLHNNAVIVNTQQGAYYYEDRKSLFLEGSPDFFIFDEASGLSDNSIMKLIPVSDSTHWASTGNGLSFINTNSKKASSYKKIAGSQNIGFNRDAGIMTSDSVIYFGSTNGVVRFWPHHFTKNNFAPKLNFTNAKIWNKPIPISKSKSKKTTIDKDISYLNKIILKPNDKVFSVNIDAINFTLPIETNYAYKLEGFDADWIFTETPEIIYTNLGPGSYNLVVKARNNDGMWSSQKSLQIEMLPPWWKTWWAYFLFFIVAGGFLYLLMQLRLQQEKRLELARAQERDIFRKRSSRDFHDEAGTRITRIALITELAKLNISSKEKMKVYLAQIEENLQDLNNGMRDFIWTLDPTKDNAFDTLIRFTEFAINFCECANIQFRSQLISDALKKKELNMAERRHLILILKEALNNSIKHGEPSIVDFKINFSPGKLELTLKDNGLGFDKKYIDENNCYGIKNMHERAKALGGVLSIQSKKDSGTKLTLKLETTRLGN